MRKNHWDSPFTNSQNRVAQGFSKCGLGKPCIREFNTTFIKMLRYDLPFSLSFSHECTVEFSRGCVTGKMQQAEGGNRFENMDVFY